MPNEAGKESIEKQSNQTLFCCLTLELSRPTAGRRQRASVAYSTLLTPRCGVGLNDLLGAKEAGENETLAKLPKLKWESPDAHP